MRRRAIETRRFCSRRIARARGSPHCRATHRWGSPSHSKAAQASMPLARRRIGSSFEYGHPDLYQNSQADTMLQDVTMASSTGTLAQIGLLSHYATELFQDLFATAQGLQERLDSATSRVRTLNAQLPRVCDVVARCDGDSVHRSGTLPEREHPQRVQFTVETMPRGLRERYDALEPPPDFSRIDALLPPEVLEKEGPVSYTHLTLPTILRV